MNDTNMTIDVTSVTYTWEKGKRKIDSVISYLDKYQFESDKMEMYNFMVNEGYCMILIIIKPNMSNTKN